MENFNYLVLMPWNNGSNIKETKVHKFASMQEVTDCVVDRIKWYYYNQVPLNIVFENSDLINIRVFNADDSGNHLNEFSTKGLLEIAYDFVEWRGEKL